MAILIMSEVEGDRCKDADGDGSVDAPFADIDDAIANVDNVCRSVAIMPGTYDLQLNWDDGDLFLIGFCEFFYCSGVVF